MKRFLEEYCSYFIYGICILLLSLSLYNIVINYKHANSLNERIVVMDSLNVYKEFKNNVLSIENNVNNNHDSKLYGSLSKILELLKKDGAFRLFPKDKLAYQDLYKLNNYFLEIINNGWIYNLSEIEKYSGDNYNEFVNTLINNANYVDKELLNNSNYAYSFNKNIRDEMDEVYKYILNNYEKFSYIILKISNEMGNKHA